MRRLAAPLALLALAGTVFSLGVALGIWLVYRYPDDMVRLTPTLTAISIAGLLGALAGRLFVFNVKGE